MLTDKSAYLLGCETAREFLMDTTDLDTEMEELLRELDVIAGLIRKCIDENSATAQDQTEYTSRYNAYVDRYEKAKARYEGVSRGNGRHGAGLYSPAAASRGQGAAGDDRPADRSHWAER